MNKLFLEEEKKHPGPPPSMKIRKRILKTLSDTPKTIKDIAEEVDITRDTTTKHLEVLKKLGKAKEIYRNATFRLFIKAEE